MLRYFAAPLARSNLDGDANVAHPTCSLARHDPRALNLCLLSRRGPLVLAFFVTGGAQCKQAVDAMQVVSRHFPTVQFAAVAVDASHAAAARVVRSHHWTIPVAYDADGAVGYQYGVEACPLLELAYRGGIVQDRLIGDHWAQPTALAQRVRALPGFRAAMNEEVDLYAAPGWIEPRLQAEFPCLALDWVSAELRRRATTHELRARLRDLSNAYRGETVVAIRQRPVGHAYRVFFREVGLDPDVTRIPLEEAALARLLDGHFVSRGLLEDAMLVALVETGVGVWALDGDRVNVAGLGIRAAVDGDRLGSSAYGSHLHAGRLVVADAESVHAVLFGDVAPEHAPTPDTERVTLFTVRVEGVPQIHIEEALWICVEALSSG